jgi:hypothetical protein
MTTVDFGVPRKFSAAELLWAGPPFLRHRGILSQFEHINTLTFFRTVCTPLPLNST